MNLLFIGLTKRKVVPIGSDVKFRCYGKIVWHYNGGALPPNVRRYFVPLNDILNTVVHIESAEIHNAGTYTCSGQDTITIQVLGK